MRFRRATFAQNVTNLPFRSIFQPYLAWLCLVSLSILMLLAGFQVFLPGHWNTSTFVTTYIGIPIFLLLYFGHRFIIAKKDPWWIAAGRIDIITGLEDLKAAEKPSEHGGKWRMRFKMLFLDRRIHCHVSRQQRTLHRKHLHIGW